MVTTKEKYVTQKLTHIAQNLDKINKLVVDTTNAMKQLEIDTRESTMNGAYFR